MKKLTSQEKGLFLDLFDRDGYVLNFTDNSFAIFTQRSIGVSLKDLYGLSKGKSLRKYTAEASDENVVKLFSDLVEYYETHFFEEINFDEKFAELFLDEYKKTNDLDTLKRLKYKKLYLKACAILDDLKSGVDHWEPVANEVKAQFSSKYMNEQIDLMMKMQFENPTDAIGKAKELIESCCKTILEKKGSMDFDDLKFPVLIKKTIDQLELKIEKEPSNSLGSKEVKGILGNLRGLAGSLVELRNSFGSGHGKPASYIGLDTRHAKLAVRSSIVLVDYLWDTFQEHQ